MNEYEIVLNLKTELSKEEIRSFIINLFKDSCKEWLWVYTQGS